MKILLTLDLDQPASPERQSSENILRVLWDQLQVTQISLELLCHPAHPLDDRTNTIDQWAEKSSSVENAQKYRTLAPSPLEDYDLIIAANISPGAESFFNSLGIRTLILRTLPCDGFDHFLLARGNFSLPEEYKAQLPPLKNLYNQEFPLGEVSKDDRHWWLANRFLINQESKDPSILVIGTTPCQTERIVNGKITSLSHFVDEFMSLLPTCPNLFYCSRQPMDFSELGFMKTINATCPCLPIPHLLARNEFDSLISIDSGLVPLAEVFQKPIKILGPAPSWSVINTRYFRDYNFIKAMAAGQKTEQI